MPINSNNHAYSGNTHSYAEATEPPTYYEAAKPPPAYTEKTSVHFKQPSHMAGDDQPYGAETGIPTRRKQLGNDRNASLIGTHSARPSSTNRVLTQPAAV